MGGLPDRRGNIPQEDEDSDAVSLLPMEDIPLPILPRLGSKFRVFQDSINKTSEQLASPLPQAHSRGDLSPQLYDVLSDHCLHSLTLNSVAV